MPKNVALSLAAKALAQVAERGLPFNSLLPYADGGYSLSFNFRDSSAWVQIYDDGTMAAETFIGCYQAWDVTPDDAGIAACLDRIEKALKGDAG